MSNASNDVITKRNTYATFMRDHYANNKADEITHTSFGKPYGKYHIPDDELEEFYDLYKEVFTETKLHITERPLEKGPLLIDIDYNYNSKNDKRRYTMEHIKAVIVIVNRTIRKYYKVSPKDILAFVTEKKSPTHKKGKEYKDGFHVQYPNIAMETGMRFLVLDELMEGLKKEGSFDDLKCTNSMNDIVDTCVVHRNGWMMYGSNKDKSQRYDLKYIIDYHLNEMDLDLDCYSRKNLVSILSNRRYNSCYTGNFVKFKENINRRDLQRNIDHMLKKYGCKKLLAKPVKSVKKTSYDSDDSFSDSETDLSDICDKVGKNNRNNDDSSEDCSDDSSEDQYANSDEIRRMNKKDIKNIKAIKNKGKLSDIELAKRLVDIMSKKRATNYEQWIRVGWALHNTSADLLGTFRKFSKKCKSKYNKASCDDVWKKAKGGGLTISSLHMWARKDNPEKYMKIIRENVNNLFVEAETGTEWDVAQVIFELYKHMYRCTNIANKTWYEFQGHSWVEVQQGYTLSNRISNELPGEFANLNSMYYGNASVVQCMQTNNGLGRDNMIKKASDIQKIILNLKRVPFKKRIMEECCYLFIDPKFEDKLDSNRHLLGFNNGVYNLQTGTFRDGSPDDFVSFTVGYDYEEFTTTDPAVIEIDAFFKKIQPKKEMREYLLTLLSTYLDGFNRQQKFILWTGTGANGKSKTVEFFKATVGDYAGVLPSTILTRKRCDSTTATPAMAGMKGKRFVVFQEPEKDDVIYVGQMKELSGGDEIYARPMYKNPIKFTPQFKMLLTCNKLPEIPSDDGGTWRRIRVTEFGSVFVKVDKDGKFRGKPLKQNQFPMDETLDEKIEGWRPAFMWMLLQRYKNIYQKDNLIEPKEVTQFTAKYQKESDVFMEFLEEHIKKKKGEYERLSSVYSCFKLWFRDSHSSKCPNKNDLKNYLTNHDYKIRAGCIMGIEMVREEEPDENDLDE